MINEKQNPIYLDYQATTPTDPRVVEKMLPYFTTHFGNPHSRSHSYGWNAETAIEEARQEIASVINSNPKEIIFTSGATESNNLAIKGLAGFYGEKGDKKRHIITVATEHKCVLNTCRHLQNRGYDITYLGVNSDGIIDLAELKAAIRPDTLVVSVMAVNNEIGVIQPLHEIGAICREHNVFFHTDAAQAFGKIPLDVEEMNIDLLSISSHKIYGPMGIGALYVRRRNPRVKLEAIIDGGGQERGMRSGTLPLPLAVGFGEAARIAREDMTKDYNHVKAMSERFLQQIMQIPDVYLNGDKEQRYPGCINLSFAYVEGESLIGSNKSIAVSSGSACTSSSLEPSYVLRALGVDEELIHTSIRFGFGRFTTAEEVDAAAQTLTNSMNRLREMSPLWELVQEGVDLKSIQWTGH